MPVNFDCTVAILLLTNERHIYIYQIKARSSQAEHVMNHTIMQSFHQMWKHRWPFELYSDIDTEGFVKNVLDGGNFICEDASPFPSS